MTAPTEHQGKETLCGLCPHQCRLKEGQTGLCGARRAEKGVVKDVAYGKITALALDPIEKKPLRRFHPGAMILSAGSFGCNMRCPFCQNYEISQEWQQRGLLELTPEQLVEEAWELMSEGNIGVAYTYNEPLINYEYIWDTGLLVHERGLVNVAVTNALLSEEPFRRLLPLLDALNIDLKGFSNEYYRWLGGDLETVKRNIGLAMRSSHVELTTLIVPGRNDSEEEMAALSAWVAGISPETPLHISRFFPRWRMEQEQPTEIKSVYRLAEIAARRLKYVYAGNC